MTITMAGASYFRVSDVIAGDQPLHKTRVQKWKYGMMHTNSTISEWTAKQQRKKRKLNWVPSQQISRDC